MLELLKEWEAEQKRVEEAIDMYYSLGIDVESKLVAPLLRLWRAYTEKVATMIGDDEEWLAWYEFENEMGRHNKLAVISGVKYNVGSVEDLAKIIASRKL